MAKESLRNSHVSIILAVIAGLLTLGLMFVFLKRVKDESKKSNANPETAVTKQILVAKRDLPSGHVLQVNTDLVPMTIPAGGDLVPFARSCVDADHAKEVDGRSIGVALPARYPLQFSNLVEAYDLADTFKQGYLKSISFSQESLFSSQLMPGDRVDVVVTLPVKDETKTVSAAPKGENPDQPINTSEVLAAIVKNTMNRHQSVESKIILENVEVFMVGSRMKSDRLQLRYSSASPSTEGALITFKLNKNDALKLTNYENTSGATLSLLMRPRTPTRNE